MTQGIPTQNKTQLSNTMAMEGGKGVPPHGLKGALPGEAIVAPAAIFATAVLIIALSALAAIVVSLLLKYRSLRKSTSADGYLQHSPGLWAELWRVIKDIKTPSDGVANAEIWDQFTSDVSLCLRRGVEIRTGRPVAERTTEEIVQMFAAGELKLSAISEQELRSMLARLDAVRFGGVAMSESEASIVLARLKQWMELLESDHKNQICQKPLSSLTVDEKGGIRVFDA